MVNDRTVQALIGRVQLGIGYEFDQGTEFELRAGGQSRYTDNDSVTASLAGTSFRYATVGDDTVLGAYVGGNFDLALTDRLNVNTDIEYGAMEGSETYILGQMAVEFVF